MNTLKTWLLFFILFPLFALAGVNKLQHGVNFTPPPDIADYYVSEKLDGVRAYWDGDKLVTRKGNLIHAPAWFVRGWPSTPLDGELWSQRGDFQNIISCIRRLPKNQNNCWRNLTFNVFDLPTEKRRFEYRYETYVALVNRVGSTTLRAVPQKRIHNKEQLNALLDELVNKGAEGLMMHHKNSRYKAGRNAQLMKYKRAFDAEAEVIKHIEGKGKYIGKLGALLVKLPDGQHFKIGTGFTDQERKNPPPVGSVVTYRYIGKTDRGIPKFASYVRIKHLE